MPNQKIIELPRLIYVGENSVKFVPELLRRLEITGRCLVVASKTTYNLLGKSVLDAIYLEKDYFILEEPKADLKDVATVKDKISAVNPELVFAIGGGKIIDTVKYACHLTNHSFVSCTTTASNNGIASPTASLVVDSQLKSFFSTAPLAVLVDLNVIMNTPQRFISSGFGDVISSITAIKDWELSNRETKEPIGMYALKLSEMSANLVQQNINEIKNGTVEGVKTLVEALISGGIAVAITGSSRPVSGSEHLFSHALDGIIGPGKNLHGHQCGLGTIIMSYLHGLDWERVRDDLKAVNAPTTAEELKTDSKKVIQALVEAKKIRKDRYTILHKLSLNESKARDILKKVGIIV